MSANPTGPAALPRSVIRLADLSARHETPVLFTPDAGARAAIAAELGLTEVRKLRLEGRLMPEGRHDWRLSARLGATVVQPCVVTLDPVVTRIDEDLQRHYSADAALPEGAEIEMPEDDTVEPLPASVDLVRIALEALALAVPDYPRGDGVAEVDLTVTEPGALPLEGAALKPFAGLAGLRARILGDDPDPDTRDGHGKGPATASDDGSR